MQKMSSEGEAISSLLCVLWVHENSLHLALVIGEFLALDVCKILHFELLYDKAMLGN